LQNKAFLFYTYSTYKLEVHYFFKLKYEQLATIVAFLDIPKTLQAFNCCPMLTSLQLQLESVIAITLCSSAFCIEQAFYNATKPTMRLLLNPTLLGSYSH